MGQKERCAARPSSGELGGGRRGAAWRWRALFAFALALLGVTNAAARARFQSPLVVACALEGTLYAWREGEAELRALASDNAVRLALSPNGTHLAYTRDDGEGRQATLWLLPLATEPSPRLLVDARTLPPADPTRQIGQFVWARDGTTLFFSTTRGTALAATPQNDLWRVTLDAHSPDMLLPADQGGLIVPDPKGVWLALLMPGRYAESPAQIAFFHTQSGERVLALRFAAVSSGSERPWHPTLRWLPEGTSARVAIPPPDWLYGKGEGVTLWELRPRHAAQQLGTVDADFFGLPRFSANGERVLYIQRRQFPQQSDWALAVATASGAEPTIYTRGALTFGAARWLPQGERFLYALNDAPLALWMGQLGRSPQRFPAPNVLVSALAWADATTFVYLTPNDDGSYTLAYANVDAPAHPTPIATLGGRPLFDAVRP